jgi:hypothetical protein
MISEMMKEPKFSLACISSRARTHRERERIERGLRDGYIAGEKQT